MNYGNIKKNNIYLQLYYTILTIPHLLVLCSYCIGRIGATVHQLCLVVITDIAAWTLTYSIIQV